MSIGREGIVLRHGRSDGVGDVVTVNGESMDHVVAQAAVLFLWHES